jgi:hypothetical protein
MSTPARQRQVVRGYAQGVDVPTPGVLFLNSEVASLAMAEFVNLWTGYRTPRPLLYYDLLKARLTSAGAERQGSCIACGEGRGLALGDLEPLPVAGGDHVPLSVPVLVNEPRLMLAGPEWDARTEREVTHGETDSD